MCIPVSLVLVIYTFYYRMLVNGPSQIKPLLITRHGIK